MAESDTNLCEAEGIADVSCRPVGCNLLPIDNYKHMMEGNAALAGDYLQV